MRFDLVLEGGGAKGTGFVGALEEFHRRGHTHGRLLGTSAGAITATLIAAGYTTDDLRADLCEKTPDGHSVLTSFLSQPSPIPDEVLQQSTLAHILRDIDLPMIPNAFGIEEKIHNDLLQRISTHPLGRHLLAYIECGGWYGADVFVEWLTQKLNSVPQKDSTTSPAFGSMTMGEFHQATGQELTLIASNVTKGIKLILNHRTAPKVPLVWAVRMSMSIPYIWDEVIWQAEWGLYRNIDISGNVVVDGSLLSNFPLDLLVADHKTVRSVMGNRIGKHVLGSYRCLVLRFLEMNFPMCCKQRYEWDFWWTRRLRYPTPLSLPSHSQRPANRSRCSGLKTT